MERRKDVALPRTTGSRHKTKLQLSGPHDLAKRHIFSQVLQLCCNLYLSNDVIKLIK